MRVLGITETCDLGSLYRRLLADGHEVRISVSEPLAAGTMAGLVPRTPDPRAELEATGFGSLQVELREAGFNVIGGSAFGDRLENDRAFAQRLLSRNGLQVAAITEHSSVASALADLAAAPRRCVFKLEFRYPTAAQVLELFRAFFPAALAAAGAASVAARLRGIANLAPGDFAAVARRARALRTDPDAEEILRTLAGEVALKRGAAARAVGFHP